MTKKMTQAHRWKKRLATLVLVSGVVILGYGLFQYIYKRTEISHFSHSYFQKQPDGTYAASMAVEGQYKTKGRGFYVGKEINITALVFLDKQTYLKLKAFSVPCPIAVDNSETPNGFQKDNSAHFIAKDAMPEFATTGFLLTSNYNDEKHTFVLSGDIVFTKPGQLVFNKDSPLRDLLNLQLEGINIESSADGDQIETNRIILLLTCVTLFIACLAAWHDMKD